MSEDLKKLVETCMDPAMSREGKASVLAYARGRLNAQREFKRQMHGMFPTDAEKLSGEHGGYLRQVVEESIVL